MIDILSNWTAACTASGLPESKAPNAGVTLGSFITPSSINPANWTRSYARSAYIDSLPPRPNLSIVSQATVLRFNLNDSRDKGGKLFAKSIEFAKSSSSQIGTVDIKKEVILAAGALSTPKIMMHSGVGPQDILTSAGVDVKLDLPGVGQRLQDHMVCLRLKSNLPISYIASPPTLLIDGPHYMDFESRDCRRHSCIKHYLFPYQTIQLLRQRCSCFCEHVGVIQRE